MRQALCENFSENEIISAIKSCDGSKSPGPDGFSLKFFKVFWEKVKPWILGMMNEFYLSGSISRGCNSSFVALIAKCGDPQELTNFRPISLVGSLYKIISKVLANRLKQVINEISSPTQSAFVGGRYILDGPLIVGETVAWAKKSHSKILIFKVDFAKAYDTLNWKFLYRMMEKMNFPHRWIEWIKGCLKSGMGSVLVNGSPTSEFKFKRGLRQGDPLSPFLFVIAMEIVSMLLNMASSLGLFHGCQLPNGGPNISHLCYADDVLFIGEWSEENVLALNRLLRWLSLVTGLNINRNKSKLYGIGVTGSEVNTFADLLKCEAGSFPFIYLGIPIGVNMKRAKYWKPVLDRFSSKLSMWKARHLSFAGRMTLAKAVLGSLPSYFLSLFSAPNCIINKLEKIRRDFVWGKPSSGHKMRWIQWEVIMKAKKRGGMGLGNIRNFNWAMLVKWWWRYNSDSNQLWASVVGAIHKGNSSLHPPDVPVKKSIPGMWKDIGSVDKSLTKVGINLKENLIADGSSWKWRSTVNGCFSIKQVRLDIEFANSEADGNALVFDWNSWAPHKVNYLLWRALMGKIASKAGLIRRGIHLADSLCPRCGLYNEDPDHIFVNCLWSKSIWWNLLVWMKISFPVDISSLKEFVSYLLSRPGGKIWKRLVYTIVLATVWRIWKARNEMTFNGCFIPINRSVELIKEDVFLWIANRSRLKSLVWDNWLSFDISGLM
ncbi:putative RNA-directed DNA polymerase [Helianthus anomalus]